MGRWHGGVRMQVHTYARRGQGASLRRPGLGSPAQCASLGGGRAGFRARSILLQWTLGGVVGDRHWWLMRVCVCAGASARLILGLNGTFVGIPCLSMPSVSAAVDMSSRTIVNPCTLPIPGTPSPSQRRVLCTRPFRARASLYTFQMDNNEDIGKGACMCKVLPNSDGEADAVLRS